MSGPLLELRSVHKSFGPVVALRDVNMALRPGEVLALCGDNGAGKSTLAKTIAGVIRPDAGQILIEGRPVTLENPADAQSKGIEIVFQDLALFRYSDVPANIFAAREITRRVAGLPLRVLDRREMKRRAAALLDELQVHIPSLDAEVRFLSGGQRQAVAIARAIAFGRRIIIMDEPTAALAAMEQRKVLDLVSRLKKRGMGVVVISHNLQHVLATADRVLVLHRGAVAGLVSATATTEHELIDLMMSGAAAAR